MGYKDPAQQRAYQLEWMNRRRDEWIRAHGPCVTCGSGDRLEVDHIDPAQKSMEPARIWSLSGARRDAELAKCQVLCYDCHKRKSASEHAAGERVGTAKLTVDVVRMIRLSTESAGKLAEQLNVSKSTVCRARRGIQWRHVDAIA